MSAVMPTYARTEIAFERGEGVYLFTPDGRRYLDFGSGVAVVGLGHAHPHLVAALTEQAKRVWHTSNLYRIPGQERLAERLARHSFADQVFFCNSGAEAMEAAIKLARKYHHHAGRPERYRVIAFSGSFHGRTLATIAAGDSAKAREGFGPLVDGFDHAAWGNLNETRALISDRTAAILVEPVQGESGVRLPPPGFLRALRQICDEFGLLLLYDEVQTGIGRTGKLFAYEWDGAAPDVMGLAKGLGGGFPIGAVLATNAAAAGMTAGSHGSTFGGNPLAAACANAVLDVMLEPGFFEHVQAMGRLLVERAQDLARRHPGVIEEVRGHGLLVGVKCVVANAKLGAEMLERQVLTVLAGDNVLRLIPPLIVEPRHIDAAIAALDESCRALAAAKS